MGELGVCEGVLLLLLAGEHFGRVQKLLDGALHLAHRPAVLDALFGELALRLFGNGHEGARVARGELALPHERDDFRRKRQKAQRVGDGGAGFAETVREFLLREVVLVHELLHRVRRFDGVEVLALQIFDEAYFADLALRVVLDDGGDAFEPRHLSGAVTAFTRDDHVAAVGVRIDDDGADDAVLADGACKVVQSAFVEELTRLIGVGIDVGKRELADARSTLALRVLVSFFRIAEQGGKPSA